MTVTLNPQSGPGRPSTGVFYSMDELARLAWVSKVTVSRLYHAGLLPPCVEVDGRRYWDRAGATEAVARIAELMAVARRGRAA